MSSRGKVYLIGAGPGDPKLITVRGVELLSRADVVVNDRLASPELLKYARKDAEIIYAGKASRDHHLTQDEIIDVIINKATQGKTVARLKGGDPFVFGRGGEEAAALVEAEIEFEVVPGVTSAIAVPAYAGIPVTSRFRAVSFGVVTGHEAAGKVGSDIKWDKIATGLDTLVFLMGVENLSNIVSNLVKNGRSEGTPAAVIQWGTHPKQRTVTGTLANIVERVEECGITAPAITIVGDVVSLREQINWFERRPLFGRRVIVTRAESQASTLSEKLRELGAEVEECPVIKFTAPSDTSDIDAAISELDQFDWVLFTSANGVEWFVRRLMEQGRDIRSLGSARIGAIGPKTAAAIEELKVTVDYVPEKYVAESVVDEFPEDLTGKRVLIPRAKEARMELVEGLENKGAKVTLACVYETVIDASSAPEIQKAVSAGEVDIVTFTSASTVRNFFTLLGDVKLPARVLTACIGPITADAARDYGLEPKVIAEEYTIEGLVDAILQYLGTGPE